jgi:hypothetical protein
VPPTEGGGMEIKMSIQVKRLISLWEKVPDEYREVMLMN